MEQQYYPWYSSKYNASENEASAQKADWLSMTPPDIKAELEKKVVKQDQALKQISVMLYQHFRGHRFVGLLAGPTGSGKTYIAEAIDEVFPGIIHIRDVSNVTCDGWSGGKKVPTLFHDVSLPHPTKKHLNPIMFLDECDKMFAPKYSHDENVSEAVQGEFLSIIHGGEVAIPEKDEHGVPYNRYLNTSKISFLFAGAFNKEASKIAEESSKTGFGFGSTSVNVEAYSRDLTMEDVQNAGCTRELCGRIGRLIPLKKLSEKDYLMMLKERDRGPVYEMEQEFQIPINISSKMQIQIAHDAYVANLGVRGMKNTIREFIDKLTWEDCNRASFDIE